ncbi:MAG: Wzz/FepE/Etk N-terminal domain-containing protein [Gammaproteobacteria bacterium]|nr:Wzz/FepE/Etk N-terminal domain-containing protein [Gammaproteobacteria bacterium]
MLNTHIEKPHLINPADNASDIDYLLKYLSEHKWHILFAAILTCVIAMSYTLFSPTEYKASVILQIHHESDNSLGSFSQTADSDSIEPISSQIALIKSDFILAPVIQSLGSNVHIEKAIAKLRSRLTIIDLTGLAGNFPNKPGLLQITLTEKNPQQVIQWINQIARVTREKDIERKSLAASTKLIFLHQELPLLKKSLKQSEVALNQFRLHNGKIDIQSQKKLFSDALSDTEKQIQSSETKLTELSQQYTQYYPEVIRLKNKIQSLQNKRDLLTNQINSLSEKNQIEANLISDIKVKNSLYVSLLNQIHAFEVIQAGITSDIGILSPATFSEKAHPLKLPLIAIASLLVGAFFGILFVLAKRIFSSPLPKR